MGEVQHGHAQALVLETMKVLLSCQVLQRCYIIHEFKLPLPGAMQS